MSKRSKRRTVFAQLDALYARLPTVACRGLCSRACSAVLLTEGEAIRIQAAVHRKPKTTIYLRADQSEAQRCTYLNDQGRCDAYAVRPFVCRAWGLLATLSCMHGCVPDRWLGSIEFAELGKAIERASGRVLRTSPEGLTHQADDTFHRLVPRRPAAEIEADDERTRHLRTLHGGRILYAGPRAR